MYEKAAGIDFCRHVRQFELNRLKFRDRLAELFPLFGVLERGFVGALRHSDGERGDADSAAIEHLERVDKALARLSQKIFFRHAAIFENDGRRVAGSQSELVFFLARKETGHAFLEDESGDAAVSGRPVGHSHRDTDIAVGAVCGEGLLAVENPAIAIQYRGRLSAGGVAAGFRFGETPRSKLFAFSERSDESPALLFGAAAKDMSGAQRIVRGHGDADGAIHASQ